MKKKIFLHTIFLFFGVIVIIWKYWDYETKKLENMKQLQEQLKHNQFSIDSIIDSKDIHPCPICSDPVRRDSLRKKIIEKRKREMNINN